MCKINCSGGCPECAQEKYWEGTMEEYNKLKDKQELEMDKLYCIFNTPPKTCPPKRKLRMNSEEFAREVKWLFTVSLVLLCVLVAALSWVLL